MNKSRFVFFVAAGMFLFLVLGLFNLEIIHGKKNRELSNKNCIRLIPQFGARGDIVDRNGEIIADSKISYDLLLLPDTREDIDNVLSGIAGVLGTNFESLLSSYRNNFLSPSLPVVIARNIGLKKAIALEELKANIPQITVQPRPQRNYPYKKLGAHIVGYLSEIDRWRLTKLADYGYKTKDIVGFGGIEEGLDYYLRQEEGGFSVEIDHMGRIVRTLGFEPPQNGKDIQLTIDLRIQKIVEDALGGRNGSVVIMDPRSGEIIAMASSPGFNPASFVDRNNSAISLYFHDKDAPLINRAISSAYPAGSIFKLIVATAALETKKIDRSTVFVCQGKLQVGRAFFKCWSTHGPENIIQAFTHSCDVFFYHTGLLVGPELIRDYALKFGLAHNTGIELPYEVGGFIPSPLWRRINKFRSWFDGDTANLSIGQGDVLVTPIQMVRVISVFANRGYLLTPYIVKAVDGKDISYYRRKGVNLSLKSETIDIIKEGLRGVVADPSGTGNILSSLPVQVAGKTGTAQAPPGQSHAWFIGFFPFKEPKYAICVFLEHGGPGYYSCVVAKQIIEGMSLQGLL